MINRQNVLLGKREGKKTVNNDGTAFETVDLTRIRSSDKLL
jgi:hypothetical protein